MSIDTIVNNEVRNITKEQPATTTYGLSEQRQPYFLFAQQYLEKPIATGIDPMAGSPTTCTIKGIPVIDDF